jgi:hypothetical protein
MTPTGPSGSLPHAAAYCADLQLIVEQFDRAVDDTVFRPALFYRPAVCKVELDLGLIVKAAHEALLDHVGTLAHRAWLHDKVLCWEYDLLLIRIDLF